MGNSANEFFDTLDLFFPYISYILFFVGAGMLLFYFGKRITIKNYKKRYDFISKYEIKVLWNSAVIWLIALVIYPRTIVSETILISEFVDLFIEISLALIIGTAIYYTLKYYYPRYLNRQLKRLRYMPRMSPKTGKPMKLLTEEEEDVYLDEGMQAEEDVFSVDYDVWIDEETGYTKIEKYFGKYTAKECPNCGYQTLKVEKEELLIAPTEYASGELLKRYKCTYCGHKEKEIFTVAKLKEEK
jgi:hypothetical protein